MEQKSTNKKETARYRNFATVVYPESAPEDWKDIIARQSVPGFISPIHDKDLNPTGEPKKAHYHVMYMFDGKKSKQQVESLFKAFSGVGCEIVNSARGMARYFCHLDNPEKARYKESDVICLGGADYMGLIGTSTDKYRSISEMCEFCDKYDVTSFYLLSKYAEMHRPDWSRALKENSTIYMKEWLKSRQWSIENCELEIIDPETGETIL